MKITSEPAHYPSIGRCIYCEATGTSLGDEHIVALGLGGNWIIKDASCKKCEIATGKVEHECLRRMLGPVRINMGFKSRHKNRPSHMRAVSVNDKGALESRMIPSEKIPMAAFMFRFEPPGIITGRPHNPGFYARQWHLNDREKLDKLLIEEGVDKFGRFKNEPAHFCSHVGKDCSFICSG